MSARLVEADERHIKREGHQTQRGHLHISEQNTGIEALTGKTHIKNYLGDYQKGEEHLSFEDFWKILEKNRIQANLKSREIFETVKTEYEKSLSRPFPIKEKLRKTDWLIDQIVYKLYRLTEDEIKLVEDVL